jgi:putative transposase
MSRKSNCWEARRHFLSLKHEQLNYEKFRTKEAAKLNIVNYLDFYNGKRAHSKLSCQSPLEFEQKFHKKYA